ncbi:MAG: exodeoxyribonuclease VII small subunit [Ruminococcus sp.]|nr:exodeoxyribonuclease VII small subunit [Ruminococcus sp.]
MSEESNKVVNYEKSMERLEEIAQKLESGKLPLDESIELYKEGKKLSADCKRALEEAQLTVKYYEQEQEKKVNE